MLKKLKPAAALTAYVGSWAGAYGYLTSELIAKTGKILPPSIAEQFRFYNQDQLKRARELDRKNGNTTEMDQMKEDFLHHIGRINRP
jgi:hypothetical protein